MKTHFSQLLSTLLLIGCLIPSSLPAMGGRITNPVISVPKPGKPGQPVDLSLLSPEETGTILFKDFEKEFVGGYFINWNTWLYFTGDSTALNRMLQELSETEGVIFNVRFSPKPIRVELPFEEIQKEKAVPVSAQWSVLHDGGQNISITIHAGEGGIGLSALRLPAMIGKGTEQELREMIEVK